MRDSHKGFIKQLLKVIEEHTWEACIELCTSVEHVPATIKAADNVTLKSIQGRKTGELCLMSRKYVREQANAFPQLFRNTLTRVWQHNGETDSLKTASGICILSTLACIDQVLMVT